MKLLLRKDVEKLGKFGDVVRVADGYARNFLLPKELAIPATPAGIKQIEIEKRREVAKQREETANIQGLADELTGFSCTITVKANEEGRLFGSVTAHQIAEALTNAGYKIDERMVVLEEPIKQCDIYNITISFNPEIKTTIKLWVVKEDEDNNGKEDVPEAV